MPGIAELAAEAFDKREYVRALRMTNVPVDYAARKQAFIDLELARAEANAAELALRYASIFEPIQNLKGRL